MFNFRNTVFGKASVDYVLFSFSLVLSNSAFENNFCFLICILDFNFYWDFSKMTYSAEGLNPPFYRQRFLYCHPPFISFFPNPHFWQHFLENIAPMKYGINTKINLLGKVVSSCLEDYETILYVLYNQHFYIHQQVEI